MKNTDFIKEAILIELRSIEVKGMEDLIKYMEKTKFFDMPASTKYHGSHKGGLAKHCWNVFNEFHLRNKKLEELGKSKLKARNVIIPPLLHDLCKSGAYILNTDGTYSYNKNWYNGHAIVSLMLIMEFIELEQIEYDMIKYHMGYYGTKEFGKYGEYSLKQLSQAQNEPLVKLFHWCDDYSSQFLED